jgi:hypothetical protein
MPKKQPRNTGFARVLAALEPAAPGGPDLPSPATAGELTDEHGAVWTVFRGPLDARLAARLVRGAELMIVGEGAGETLRTVPAGARAPLWRELRDRLDSPYPGAYRAFEFRSVDGRRLLYLEESC